MIKKVLNKLGYIHQDDITDEMIFERIGQIIGDPREHEISKEFEAQFFKDLNSVDRIHEFLDATLAADMKREFSSTVDQRDIIQGAFARTAYLKGKLRKFAKA